MAFEIDFVAEGISNSEKKTNLCKLIFLSFNSVHIPQSLEITDAKISLRKVPLKVTSCWGQQLKIQLVVATDQIDFMAQNTQLFSENFHKTTYKCSYSNQHHFQYV